MLDFSCLSLNSEFLTVIQNEINRSAEQISKEKPESTIKISSVHAQWK
jgi:hypothetical protein